MKETRIFDSGNVFDHSYSYHPEIRKCVSFIGNFFRDDEIKGKKILDAGCRIGHYCYAFNIKGCHKVVGVDLSNKCLESAKSKFKRYSNMKFYFSDIRNLSIFKNSEFDIVFCMGVIIYLGNKGMKEALSEFIRVTKPGGKILVTFQKEKGLLVRILTCVANAVPISIFVKLIDYASKILAPSSKFILGRKVDIGYFKYNVLLSLRGVNYGIPTGALEKFRIKTPETELSSEKTTATYKIIVPRYKGKLLKALKS